MKITLIHGQNHHGSTYHICGKIADLLNGEVEEFFLPAALSVGCNGCYNCLNQGRESCPHANQVEPIFRSMLAADIIIIGSPTYVLQMSGHLKNFFDHLFTAWLSHRPEEVMFLKQAIVVSTAAGFGMNNVTKSLAQQMFYLGVPQTYRLPLRVAATSWADVKNKDKIDKKIAKLLLKVKRNKKVKVGFKHKFMFMIMRLMQNKNDWALLDRQYWQEKGWLDKTRPY